MESPGKGFKMVSLNNPINFTVILAIDQHLYRFEESGFLLNFLLLADETFIMRASDIGEDSNRRLHDSLEIFHFARFGNACFEYSNLMVGLNLPERKWNT